MHILAKIIILRLTIHYKVIIIIFQYFIYINLLFQVVPPPFFSLSNHTHSAPIDSKKPKHRYSYSVTPLFCHSDATTTLIVSLSAP